MMFVFLCVPGSWDYGSLFWWSTPPTKQSSLSPSPTMSCNRSSPPASHPRTAFVCLLPSVSVSPVDQYGGGERDKKKLRGRKNRKWWREGEKSVLWGHKQNHKHITNLKLCQAQGTLKIKNASLEHFWFPKKKQKKKQLPVHVSFTIFSQWHNEVDDYFPLQRM